MHLPALYVSLYSTLLTFCSCNISNLGRPLHWKTALVNCVEYCQTDNTAYCDGVWCMLQQNSRSMNCYKAGNQRDVSPIGLSNFMLPNLITCSIWLDLCHFWLEVSFFQLLFSVLFEYMFNLTMLHLTTTPSFMTRGFCFLVLRIFSSHY